MNSPFYTLLSALPLAVCFFWTILFLCQYPKADKSRKIMFWFMLTSTVLYFGHFIFFNKIYTLFPLTDSLYNFTTIAVYPIYYLYILSLTGKVRWKHLLVLLPALVLATSIGILYALMPAGILEGFIGSYEYGKGTMPESTLASASSILHDLVKIIFAIQIIPILYFGLKKLKNFKMRVNEYFSGSENQNINAISNLLIFFVVTSLFSATANLIGRTFFSDGPSMIILPSLLFSILLFAVGYAGNRQHFTIEDLDKESGACERDEIPLPLEHEKELKTAIDELMAEKKLYLDPQLKLSDVANSLNTNRTYVYNALTDGSDGEKISFSDYVNTWRIRHAMDLLQQTNDKKTSIEGIIYESGFQSKSTFYTNFKKMTGMTPIAWIEKQKKA